MGGWVVCLLAWDDNKQTKTIDIDVQSIGFVASDLLAGLVDLFFFLLCWFYVRVIASRYACSN